MLDGSCLSFLVVACACVALVLSPAVGACVASTAPSVACPLAFGSFSSGCPVSVATVPICSSLNPCAESILVIDPVSVGSPAFVQALLSLRVVTFCPNSLPAFFAVPATAPTALPRPLFATAPALSKPEPTALPAPLAAALPMLAAPAAAFLAICLMSISLRM